MSRRPNLYELLNDFSTTHNAKPRKALLAHLAKYPMSECFLAPFEASIVKVAREHDREDRDALCPHWGCNGPDFNQQVTA